MKHTWMLPLFASLLLVSSCASSGTDSSDFQVYETRNGQPVAFATMISEIQDADVIFLGEEHDNDVGHRLQLRTIEALFESRPAMILTLEQFEADVQYLVDLYMAGGIDEHQFLEHSRPWGNYIEHYKPMLEFAKQNGIEVIAANIPRPVARKVAYEGLDAVDEERLATPLVWTAEPEYGEFFAKAMGRDAMDPNDAGLQRWFAAQCVKDEKMAESISRALVRAWADGERPLVVHLNGKFHSNRGLGTVSRLKRRHPRLDVRIVGMNSDSDRQRELSQEEREDADFMWLVKPQ